MKHRTTIILGTAALGILTLLMGCGKSDEGNNGSDVHNQAEQPISVQVEVLKPRLFADAITVTGSIRTHEDVMLSPEEGGVVKEWLVRRGESVAKGQIIALLNDDLVQASYDAALAQYKMSQLNFEAQEKVYKEKAVSELQYKNAMYGRDAAKAQADMMLARLERTRVKSPINGILNDRMKNVGEFAPPMAPIAHIVNLRNIRAAGEVSEKYAGMVKLGNQARVVPDVFASDTLEGRVTFVGAAVSSSNRTLPIEVVIPNPGLRLKPEMIVRMTVMGSAKRNALLVGENILQEVDRNKMVVYVENNGKAEERLVKLGGREGALREIVEGLKAGDRVITSGFQKLTNGQPIQVVQ